MNLSHGIVIGTAVYFLLFAIVVTGIGFWLVRRRKDRTPVEFKLLRGPGETLRERLRKFDENFLLYMIGAALVPVIVGTAVLQLLIWTIPTMRLWLGLVIVGIAFLLTLIPSGRWMLRRLMRYRSDALGYRGERYVAEQLGPLLSHGYRVFHDVPAEGARRRFNLDHVAVGPTGVTVIETKTYRKGRARKGFKDHEVSYDGRKLVWPWGESAEELAQVRNEADWLGQWIDQRLGIQTKVKAVLAMPGWWVKSSACEPVNVVNAKSVVSAVERREGDGLSPEQIDLIARQLESICRDVED